MVGFGAEASDAEHNIKHEVGAFQLLAAASSIYLNFGQRFSIASEGEDFLVELQHPPLSPPGPPRLFATTAGLLTARPGGRAERKLAGLAGAEGTRIGSTPLRALAARGAGSLRSPRGTPTPGGLTTATLAAARPAPSNVL